jgi:hypothetical protein
MQLKRKSDYMNVKAFGDYHGFGRKSIDAVIISTTITGKLTAIEAALPKDIYLQNPPSPQLPKKASKRCRKKQKVILRLAPAEVFRTIQDCC